jgi:hypothetical protein
MVSVREYRAVRSRVRAELAVILDAHRPVSLLRRGDLPADADEDESLASYLGGGLRSLRPFGGTPAREPLRRVGFDPEYAVIMHRRTPLVVPAISVPLRTEDAVASLLESTQFFAIGPDARLPGETPDLPPGHVVCACINGHTVENPPDTTCAVCGEELIC